MKKKERRKRIEREGRRGNKGEVGKAQMRSEEDMGKACAALHD